MIGYDFDSPVGRRGTDSYKWDTPESAGVLPMWVADMDFRTAPCVVDALRGVVDRQVFGYTYVPDDFYEAAIDWFSSRHGFVFSRNDVIYTSGVVPAVSAVIKALTSPGDGVALLTPAYNCFFSSIRNNGCRVAACPMALGEDGKYCIDFNRLEEVLSGDDVKVFILCNPHNPGGRVWRRDELMRIGQVCLSHGVRIISADIHCELVYDPYTYIPLPSIDPDIAAITVSCLSPSKAFNTAGLQIALIVSPDDEVRDKIDRAINDNEVCDVNPFGVAALKAAYTQGSGWLGALKEYLYGNYRYLSGRFAEELPEVTVMPLEGTYLAWVNITALGRTSGEINDYLHDNAQVRLNPGTMYGDDGEGYIRINFACPRRVLAGALDRIIGALRQIEVLRLLLFSRLHES